MASKEIKFEAALSRLEEIVGKLEEGDIPLDDSLRLFEEGVKLSRACDQKLQAAERRIEILLTDEEGRVTTLPFEPKDGASGEE